MSDDRFTTVAVDSWDELCAAMERAFETVEVTDEACTGTSGAATFRVHRDGRVEAGMPLHDVDTRVDALGFDVDGGAVHVETDALDYVFRIP